MKPIIPAMIDIIEDAIKARNILFIYFLLFIYKLCILCISSIYLDSECVFLCVALLHTAVAPCHTNKKAARGNDTVYGIYYIQNEESKKG